MPPAAPLQAISRVSRELKAREPSHFAGAQMEGLSIVVSVGVVPFFFLDAGEVDRFFLRMRIIIIFNCAPRRDISNIFTN